MSPNGAGGRRPWFKFWPSDWMGDPKLSRCSLAAQGLWLRLLCVAHESEPYGQVQGDLEELALVVGRPIDEVGLLLDELTRRGVCTRTDDAVISRRMVRDRAHSVKGREDKLRGLSAPPPSRVPSRGASRVPSTRAEPLASDSSSASVPVPTYETSLEDPSLRSGAEPPMAAPRSPRGPRKLAEGPHPEAMRLWEALYAQARGRKFAWSPKHAASIALCRKYAEDDLAEFERRARILLFTPPDTWNAQNATPALLASRWNELGDLVVADPNMKTKLARDASMDALRRKAAELDAREGVRSLREAPSRALELQPKRGTA